MRSPLAGPPPALPEPLDRVRERWARLAPRLRLALVSLGLMLLVSLQAAQVSAIRSQWGGQGQRVWRATTTVGSGASVSGSLQAVMLPVGARPATAVTGSVDPDARLSVPLIQGAILTELHLSPIGPAVTLPPDQRAVPVPVERAWGIETGSVVDVWASIDGTVDASPIASNRTVLQVREEGARTIALVAVDSQDVASTTTAISRGIVLLTLVGQDR